MVKKRKLRPRKVGFKNRVEYFDGDGAEERDSEECGGKARDKSTSPATVKKNITRKKSFSASHLRRASEEQHQKSLDDEQRALDQWRSAFGRSPSPLIDLHERSVSSSQPNNLILYGRRNHEVEDSRYEHLCGNPTTFPRVSPSTSEHCCEEDSEHLRRKWGSFGEGRNSNNHLHGIQRSKSSFERLGSLPVEKNNFDQRESYGEGVEEGRDSNEDEVEEVQEKDDDWFMNGKGVSYPKELMDTTLFHFDTSDIYNSGRGNNPAQDSSLLSFFDSKDDLNLFSDIVVNSNRPPKKNKKKMQKSAVVSYTSKSCGNHQAQKVSIPLGKDTKEPQLKLPPPPKQKEAFPCSIKNIAVCSKAQEQPKSNANPNENEAFTNLKKSEEDSNPSDRSNESSMPLMTMASLAGVNVYDMNAEIELLLCKKKPLTRNNQKEFPEDSFVATDEEVHVKLPLDESRKRAEDIVTLPCTKEVPLPQVDRLSITGTNLDMGLASTTPDRPESTFRDEDMRSPLKRISSTKLHDDLEECIQEKSLREGALAQLGAGRAKSSFEMSPSPATSVELYKITKTGRNLKSFASLPECDEGARDLTLEESSWSSSEVNAQAPGITSKFNAKLVKKIMLGHDEEHRELLRAQGQEIKSIRMKFSKLLKECKEKHSRVHANLMATFKRDRVLQELLYTSTAHATGNLSNSAGHGKYLDEILNCVMHRGQKKLLNSVNDMLEEGNSMGSILNRYLANNEGSTSIPKVNEGWKVFKEKHAIHRAIVRTNGRQNSRSRFTKSAPKRPVRHSSSRDSSSRVKSGGLSGVKGVNIKEGTGAANKVVVLGDIIGTFACGGGS
eukprot:Nk52_evm13s359 gene=Nk52_evmTU13s359